MVPAPLGTGYVTLKSPHTSLSFKSLPKLEEGSLAPLVACRIAAKATPERSKFFSEGLQPQEATRRGTRGNVCCKDLTTKAIVP